MCLHPRTEQVSSKDKNADLCAARNYHDTLQAHGVATGLVLVKFVNLLAGLCSCLVCLLPTRLVPARGLPRGAWSTSRGGAGAAGVDYICRVYVYAEAGGTRSPVHRRPPAWWKTLSHHVIECSRGRFPYSAVHVGSDARPLPHTPCAHAQARVRSMLLHRRGRGPGIGQSTLACWLQFATWLMFAVRC